MGKAVFFEGVERWFLRWLMRSRLRRLGLKEPVVELSWGRGGGGFGVHDGNGREVATVRPVGDGRLLEVRMIEVSEYGWRLSSHRKVESARREVEGQVWYQACERLAERAEKERDEGGRQRAVERLERELGMGREETRK